MQAGVAAYTHQQRQDEIAVLWKQHRLGPRSTEKTPFLVVTFYQSVQNLSTVSSVINLLCLVCFPGLLGASGCCCFLHSAIAWCWFHQAVQQGKPLRTVFSAKDGAKGDATPHSILEGK